MLVSRITTLLFFVSFFAFFSSCDDDMDSEETFALPDCIAYGDLRGSAEINGEKRWLSSGDVSAGESAQRTTYGFIIGGPRLDCSIYEEINIEFLQANNVDPSGTYEIVPGNNNEIGFASGSFGVRPAEGFIAETDRFDLISGTASIQEVGLLRYEISFEGIAENGETISLTFSNAL